jgi:hypothetical protein
MDGYRLPSWLANGLTGKIRQIVAGNDNFREKYLRARVPKGKNAGSRLARQFGAQKGDRASNRLTR